MITRSRVTKIIATLGPSSADYKVVEQLLCNGADIFRINFSHGTRQDHINICNIVRSVAEKHKIHIPIIQDLQGTKLRVGNFVHGKALLRKGQSFVLDLHNHPGDETRVYFPYPEVIAAFSNDTAVFLDDGNIKAVVTDAGHDCCTLNVLVGGYLSDNKGINVPDVSLPVSAMTAKDIRDLEFGLSLGFDFVALSFVQTPQDVVTAQKIIDGKARIIAKIEKPIAVDNITKIVSVADIVMVARGDLGVEIGLEKVPVVQQKVINECNAQSTPVVVATQILESMISNAVPTRAEVSDIASSVYDGVNALMLSAETASGQYPCEAVAIMDKVITEVESHISMDNTKCFARSDVLSAMISPTKSNRKNW